MRHRIFISINLPGRVKKRLKQYQEKWPELPIKWVRDDNLHITLAFIGYLNDDEILDICKIARDVGSKTSSFSITLNKVCYGPSQELKKVPRMVWVEGEKSEELGRLQKILENHLINASGDSNEMKIQPYTSHITLGRIYQWEFRKIEPEERPEINEEIRLDFPVDSMEVMESELKRGGPRYTVLESIPFNQDE